MNPSTAPEYLTVTWSREGAVLPPGEWVDGVVTISVADDVTRIEAFSFNIEFIIEG